MATSRTLPIDLVQAAVSFALRRGWDVNALLAEAGVSPMLLADGRSRVTEEQLVTLVQGLWRTTDDELFGLGQHPLPRGTFRLLCYAVLGAADLGESLDRLEGFLKAVPAIPMRIEVGEDVTTIGLPVESRDDPEHLITAVGLAAIHRLLCWGVRKEVSLIRMDLPTPRPVNIEGLRFFLSDEVRFDAPSAALVFANTWLRMPLMRDEGDIDEFISGSPRQLLRRPSYGTTPGEQVRRLLEMGPKTGEWPDAVELAARLSMSPQTLRRKLGGEETSVRQLTEQVRRDAAVTSLVRGRESIADLSLRLGFSEPSAFTRAFRRWTGSTPGSYRG